MIYEYDNIDDWRKLCEKQELKIKQLEESEKRHLLMISNMREAICKGVNESIDKLLKP